MNHLWKYLILKQIKNYQNKEKFDLTNPQLTAKCDGDFVASNSLAIPTPSTITAGHEGKIDLSIKLKSKLTPTRSEQKMYSIKKLPKAVFLFIGVAGNIISLRSRSARPGSAPTCHWQVGDVRLRALALVSLLSCSSPASVNKK